MRPSFAWAHFCFPSQEGNVVTDGLYNEIPLAKGVGGCSIGFNNR